MSRFISAGYASLQPYTPGEQPKQEKLIKLNTNESPYEPSPEVIKILTGEESKKLRLYSDPEGLALRQAIAENFGLKTENVALGNGSDELLAFSFMIFQKENKKIYFPAISYGFYPVYAEVYGAVAKSVPLTGALEILPEDYKNLDGTIIIANPNAPTGIGLDLKTIEGIVQSNKENLVIIDEAYIDFGGESAVPLIERYDNLLIIQTFSKSRSLAGARVGFALGNAEIIQDLNKIRFSFNPYNLNRLSLLAAQAAIKDRPYFEKCTRTIMETRETFAAELLKLGFKVLPSKANFVFASHANISGGNLLKALREKGILVRHFHKEKIENYIRITIGTAEQMEECLTALAGIVKGYV